MATSSGGGGGGPGGGESNDASKRRSIVVMDMPVEFINRDILKTHFEQFGTVERLACSVSKKYAVVHFSTEKEAETAAARGAVIRPDAPRLKIINRNVGGGPGSSLSINKPAAAAATTTISSTPQPPTARLVTKRKIVRNFNFGGSSSNFTVTASPEEPLEGSGSSSSIRTSRPHPPSQPLATTRRETTHHRHQQQQSQIPLRSSSIKISRPSPFLRKKPSFGDKTGKATTPTTAPRNPFALPSRSLLSLDRRKKTVAAEDGGHYKIKMRPSGSMSGKSSVVAASGSGGSGKIGSVDKTERVTVPEVQSQAEGSSPAADTGPKSTADPRITQPPDQPPPPPPPHHSSSSAAILDIDETTEDAPVNDDEEETVDEAYDDNNEQQQQQYNDDDEYDGGGIDDADTQDTAEVTTEEEGEILGDDDDDDEQDQQEDDDEDEGDEQEEEQEDEPFESPLKRAAEMAAGAKASTSSSSSGGGGLFSFKLKPATASGTESSFKLPFTSPFSSGSNIAPKPFSASSSVAVGGSQFGGSASGSSIFSSSGLSSASTSSSSIATQQEKKSFQSSSAKENLQPPPQTDSKRETVAAAAKPDPQKASAQFSFGSTFSSSSATSSFGRSNPFDLGGSSSKSMSFGTPGSSTAAAPLKPSAAFPVTSKSASSATSVPSLSSLPRRVMTPSTATTAAIGSLPSTSKAARKAPLQQQQQQQQQPASKDSPNPLLLTLYPDTTEAQELFSKRSTTVEERYRNLEARDKLIRSRVPKTKVNVEFATKLIGTCPDMCPEKERYMRQFQRQLVSYETLAGPDFIVDHQKAIKAYSRSSADQEEPLPHELRPGSTLDFTMHYLLRFIVPLGDNPDENLSDWYNFLWDRTRSIRKDITQQQIVDLTAVSLYEKCARFHIHCSSRLCELDVHSFDPKLNDENLMKCLQSLEHLYEDLRRRQVNCPSEPEFRAYQIMMNLNEGDALYNAQQLPSWILDSEQVQTALKLHHSIYTKNFVAFFKMVSGLPYMISCILHRYFFQVRSLALRCFMKAHCTLPKYETAMPMSVLQRMLGFGPDQSLSFSFLCEAHGIHCDVDDGRVILKRKMFYLPESPSIYREAYLVDSKLGTSVAEAVNGGPLPDIDFANHKPHCSFDETGQLIPGSIVGGIGTAESRSSFPDFVPPVISTSSSSSGRFQFQQPKPISSFPAPAAASSSSQPPPFSFGAPLGGFQRRKEVPMPMIPAPLVSKPRRDIESACQVVTSKLIEESVRSDVAEVSQVELEEARRMQERDQRRRLTVQVACRVAAEWVEQTISQEVDKLIKISAVEKSIQLNDVENVSRSATASLTEETVLINLRASARTELQRAEEFQTRLITTLRQIFQRIRARFVVYKWTRFTKSKKLEREKEEEKRREQLWNFPVINSFSHSTSQVYHAFCGKSKAQPSLDKAEFLFSPPKIDFSNVNLRPKRKSDGDAATDHSFGGPKKLPRLSSGTDIMMNSGFHSFNYTQERLNDMWEFPASNPYARTNRQVFQAFCGSSSSMMANLPVSPKMITFGNFNPSNDTTSSSSPFKIHKPQVPLSMNRVTEEIRTKANESISDLLQNIKGFVTQVKEEKEKSANLDPYVKGMELVDRTCSELSSPIAGSVFKPIDQDDEESMDDDDDEADWLNNTNNQQQRPNFLSGVFLEEDDLLSKIRNFVRDVKVEKKAVVWSTDTFLNDIELEEGVLL